MWSRHRTCVQCKCMPLQEHSGLLDHHRSLFTQRNFMQATTSRTNARTRGGPRPSFKGIGRAVQYLTHYGRQALLPYLFLIIATLSQLAVPHLVRNVIDAVTSGYIANQVAGALDKIPAAFVSQALPKILE